MQALLTQPSREDAARAAGVDSSTLRRYMKDPDFLQAYNEAVRGMIEDVTRKAQQALSPAITTLREITEDKEAGCMARISASRSLLEYGLKLTEAVDIMRELNELRQAINAGD